MRITAAAPELLVSDANQYAMCLGFSEADGETYRGLNWVDAQGNLYAAASFDARDEWIIFAQAPLQRPLWDTEEIIDMVAAERAQAALVFSLETTLAMPDKLTALGGPDAVVALAAMGLTQVEMPIGE
jgi:hypothetical protein